MSENTATVAPQGQDEASQWYADLRANSIRNIDARLEELASGHSALENTWNELNQRQEDGLASDDMRTVLETERERARLQQEAQQIQQGYGALQAERQRLEQHTDPRFEELIANSSAPSQMFLRVHRHKLENDPSALKQLMFADARAKAAGLKPDSNHYFRSLEAAVGLDASDRNIDGLEELSDEMQSAKNSTKRTQERTEKFEPTPEQRQMAREMAQYGQGHLTEDEYLKSCAKPFSQASQAIGDESKEAPIEVKFDEQEKPARKTVDPAKYKPSQNSMTLSPAQVKFCTEAGLDPKEYVKHALDVQSGKSNHQWYEARLKSQGLA